jgi:hypothetical protein
MEEMEKTINLPEREMELLWERCSDLKREFLLVKMRSFLYLKGIEGWRYVLCVQTNRAEGSDSLVCEMQRDNWNQFGYFFQTKIMVVTNRTRVIHISTQGSLVFSSYHFLLRWLLLLL